MDILSVQNFFFVGIAGTGMSAIAQYLHGTGKSVSGSDRQFGNENKSHTQETFESIGLHCFNQDGSGITKNTEVVVVSTAIEASNIEYQKALELDIPIVKRSALLAAISDSQKTIAIGGTSGKSTTAAMVFHILEYNGVSPSLITGAGLSSLQKKGMPGNAWVGDSEWMVIEADESDGSIVGYHPEIAVVLNIDRDHKEFDELIALFSTFKQNTRSHFLTNQDYELTKQLSVNVKNDFGTNEQAGICGLSFKQDGFKISFSVNNIPFTIPVIGKHNMENALAAISACLKVGLTLEQISKALESYQGIYRRTQVVGEKDGVVVIDDFAHNPAEVAAAIRACQQVGRHVHAWFQPHGFGPLRFMHEELSEELIKTLRENDIVYLSDVYYAGGTVNKDINSDIVVDVVEKHKNALYIPNKNDLITELKNSVQKGDVVLLMGARDPNLAQFALQLYKAL